MTKNKKSSKGGLNGLKFDGKQMVYRRPIERKDFHRQFTVLENNKIAEFDENVLMDTWSSLIKPPWRKRIANYLKYGLLARTFPIIALYLFSYYIIYLVKSTICDSECVRNVNERNESQSDSKINGFVQFFFFIIQNKVTNQSNICVNDLLPNNNNGAKIDSIVEAEYHMTRISTLLIGFFVAFTIRTYSSYTIKSLPTVNSFCIAMGSFISVKRGINEEEVFVDFENRLLSLKQFKKDITRYFFLSWAMCFCRISPPLIRSLPNPEAFNKKKLLTKLEYNKLKILELRTENDCWLENWPMPLFWINKMICSIGKGSKTMNKNGDIAHGVTFGETKELGITLFKTKDQLEILSKQYYHGPPDLMLQCITLALYSVIFLGIIAAQPSISCLDDNSHPNLLGAFPLFYCVKYILLIGWLKTAKHLTNPFGDDNCDIKLLNYLDFQIWRASNMMFQQCPYDQCDEKYESFMFENLNEFWDDEWHEVIEHQNCFEPKVSEQKDENVKLETNLKTNQEGSDDCTHMKVPENSLN